MDENELLVKISAQIDGLQSGLSQAQNLIQNATNSIQNGFKGVGSSASSFSGMLTSVLAGGQFLIWQQIAEQALHAVEGAFGETVGKAEEFGLSNAKFAREMGISNKEASGLSEALQGVGVSSERYASIAFMLSARVGQQEEKFKAARVVTRDMNGELLGGKAIVDSLVSAMQKYPDQAMQIATLAGARRAKDLFDIMRAGQGEIDKLTGLMTDFGVQTGDTSAMSAKMEEQLNELRVVWDSIWIAIGQRLMPIVQDFTKWAEGPGQSSLHAVATGIGLIVDVVVILGAIFLEVGEVIGGIIAEMVDWVVGWGEVWYDVLTGQFSKAVDRAKGVFTDLGDTFDKTVANMKATAAGAADIIAKLYGGPPKQDANGAYGGKNGQNPPVHGTPSTSNKAAEEARKMQDEILQAAEHEALEEIKVAQDKNNFLYQTGQITADQLAQRESDLANKKLQITTDFYNKKAAADAKDPVEHQKDLDKIKEAEQQNALELQQIHERAASAQRQADQMVFEDHMKDIEGTKASETSNLGFLQNIHAISAQERIADEKKVTAATLEEQIKAIRGMEVGLNTQSTEYKKFESQIVDLTRQANLQIQTLNQQSMQETVQKWQTAANSIAGSFKSAIAGMLQGTMTWRQAMLSIVNGIVNAFLDMGEKILEDMIDKWVEEEILGKTSADAQAIGQISAAAGVAAANAYAAYAAFPPVAAAMAGEAAGTVLSFSSFLVAEKGAVLDEDSMVMAHAKETILPPNLSMGLQELIANGGGGGDTHLHYSPTITHNEATSLKQALAKESNEMLSWVKARVRDGSLKAPPPTVRGG